MPMPFIAFMAATVLRSSDDRATRDVKAALSMMERSAASSPYARNQLAYLPRTSAHIIESLIPTIQHPAVLSVVSQWMAANKVVSVIPTLIKTLDRTYGPSFSNSEAPAYRGLESFGYLAIPALLRFVETGTPMQRRRCAELLVERCPYGPVDPRLKTAMIRLAHDPEPELRLTAARGLWRIALHPHNWSMDDVHYFDLMQMDPLRTVSELAFDGNPTVASEVRAMLWDLLKTVEHQIQNADNLTDGYPKIQALVANLLSHKQPEIRLAATILESSGPGIDLDRFKMLSDPDPAVFHAALVACRISVPEVWVPKLIDLAGSASAKERRVAAILLTASLSPNVKSALAKLANDRDRSVRMAART